MTQPAVIARFLAWHGGIQVLALFALGVFAALGMPPLGYVWATLAGFAGLFAVFSGVSTARRGAVWAWAFGTGYFCFALRWLVEPFQVDAATFGWMAPFALALMAAGLALFWGLAGWIAARFWAAGWLRTLAFVLTLALAEYARATVLTGFPWAGLAQVWVATPVAQALAQVGPHGLGLMTLCASAALAVCLQYRMAGLISVIAMAAVFALATWRIPPEATADTDARPVIRIVQPNAPQDEKWDPEKWQVFFWRQVDATRAPGPRPDLIVWPETAIPQLANHADEALSIVGDAAQGVPVVLGMQRADARWYYNALLVLDAGGQITQTYDKHHLVPFGEYMPFPALFRSLGIRALAERADSGYGRGAGPEVLDLGAAGRALALICYEAVFPQHARISGERPDFLLQITNDAWFGTYAGPQQHLAQARMRAIEQGLPLVRSANTGISAMIDARGHVVASLELGTHGFVDARLPAAGPVTLYARTGDWPVLLLLLCGFVAGIWARTGRNPIDAGIPQA